MQEVWKYTANYFKSYDIIHLLNILTFETNTPMTEVASSGEEEPAAIRVAPATSGVRQRRSETLVREGTK